MTEAIEQLDENGFLEEHERLEDLLRSKSYSTKKEMADKIQFKNRLIDLFEIALLNSADNKALRLSILAKLPSIANKLCLSTKYNYLNTNKILKAMMTFVYSLKEAECVEFIKHVEEIVKTAFNIMVYKKTKQNISQLLKMVQHFIKLNNKKIERVVTKNLDILMNFIQKGKNIDKILFSFEKILDSSDNIFKDKYEELLNVLAKTSNKFFIEYFVLYLGGYFAKVKAEGLKDFSEKLNRHIIAIHKNLKANGFVDNEKGDKKTKKVERAFKNVVERFAENAGAGGENINDVKSKLVRE